VDKGEESVGRERSDEDGERAESESDDGPLCGGGEAANRQRERLQSRLQLLLF
jgi:hypothetical protein